MKSIEITFEDPRPTVAAPTVDAEAEPYIPPDGPPDLADGAFTMPPVDAADVPESADCPAASLDGPLRCEFGTTAPTAPDLVEARCARGHHCRQCAADNTAAEQSARTRPLCRACMGTSRSLADWERKVLENAEQETIRGRGFSDDVREGLKRIAGGRK